MSIKEFCVMIFGIAGGTISSIFGGWNAALTTLCVFMLLDYISGLAVAGIFKKSPRSENGALESRTSLKGICRKCAMLLFVLIAHRLDLAMNVTFIKDGVISAFICNEAISLVENAGLMGLPLPNTITRAIEILKEKTDEKEEKL